MTKLTAQTSQGELGAGDLPSSNERGDVSMGDMSVPRPSKAASAMTHRADVPRDVDAPILLTQKPQWSSPGENRRIWLNVRAQESRRRCRTSSVKRSSCGKVRCVYGLSNLHVAKRSTSSGTSRKSVIGLENVWGEWHNFHKNIWRWFTRFLIDMSSKKRRLQFTKGDRVIVWASAWPFQNFTSKIVKRSTLFSLRQNSCRRCVNWIIYEDKGWCKMGFSSWIQSRVYLKIEQILTWPLRIWPQSSLLLRRECNWHYNGMVDVVNSQRLFWKRSTWFKRHWFVEASWPEGKNF